MSLDIREETITSAVLSEHAAIAIAFVVDRVLEIRLLEGGPRAPGRSAGRDALTSRTGGSSAPAGTARAPAVP